MPTGIIVSNEYSDGSNFFFGCAFLNHGQVSRTGIKHQQIILILRKRQRVGMRSYRKIGDDLTQVDVVDRDVIRSEVRDVQARVIERNHSASRLGADQITPRNFVGRGLDHGDAAGIEIEGDQFSAIRLQRQAHRRFSDIEQRQQFVDLLRARCSRPVPIPNRK